MSRAYHIRIRESLSRHVEVGEGIESKLEILELLPPEQMVALLEHELDAAGFTLGPEGEWVREHEGVQLKIDPRSRALTIQAHTELSLQLTREALVSAWSENEARRREQAQRELQEQLEHEAEQAREQLSADLNHTLRLQLHTLRTELQQLATRVTIEALKRKAATLGEVQAISEDPKTGSLTIRVKV